MERRAGGESLKTNRPEIRRKPEYRICTAHSVSVYMRLNVSLFIFQLSLSRSFRILYAKPIYSSFLTP